jgi:tetratricopeptide (TPR) repeat protein
MGGAVAFHYDQAASWDNLERCLIDVRIGPSILAGLSTHEVFQYWNAIARAQGASHTNAYMERAMHPAWEAWRASGGDRRELARRNSRLIDLLVFAGGHEFGLVVSESCLEISRQVADEEKTPQSLRDLSICLDNVARINQVRGNLLAALSKYEDSLAIRRNLAARMKNPKSLRDLSISLNNVARIMEVRGSIDAAVAKYQVSLRIARDLAKSLRTSESLRDLSVSLSNLARIEEIHGDPDEAYRKHTQSLAILRGLSETMRTRQSLRDLSVSLREVARFEMDHNFGFYSKEDRREPALSNCAESLAISRVLAEAMRDPQSLHDLSVSLREMARFEEEREDLKAALSNYAESLAISRGLAETMKTPQSLRDLSVSLREVARFEMDHTHPDDIDGIDAALSKYAESLAILRGLSETRWTRQSLRDFSAQHFSMTRFEAKREQLEETLSKYEESVKIARVRVESNRKLLAIERNRKSLRDLSSFQHFVLRTTHLIAKFDLVRGEAKSALSRLDAVEHVLADLQHSTDGNQLATVAVYWELRAQALDGLKQSSGAAKSRDRAKSIRDRIRMMPPPK